MSCGQAPGYDDVCAGDRLGRLLNRARTDAGTGKHTPPITSAHLHTPAGERSDGLNHVHAVEGVQVCACISADTHPSPTQEVRR
jgi:hypothetical protein